MNANQPFPNKTTQLEGLQRVSETRARADNQKMVTDAEQVDTVKQDTLDVPPNGGYGWVCVACVFWINAHTWGINSVRSLTDTVSTSSADRFTVLWSFPRLLPCP